MKKLLIIPLILLAAAYGVYAGVIEGSGVALDGNASHVYRGDGSWAAAAGTYTAPTGTGYAHVTSGSQDTASKTAAQVLSDIAALSIANHLSDIGNATAGRRNLGLGTAATVASSSFLAVANNLSDLGNATAARRNLSLVTGTGGAGILAATKGTSPINILTCDNGTSETCTLSNSISAAITFTSPTITGGTITTSTFGGTLNNGVVATTQTAGDNSTKIATDKYVDVGLATKQASLTKATSINGNDGNFTTLEKAGVTVLASAATGVQTFLTTPSSANLAAAVTDETGTGLAVFNTNPIILQGSSLSAGVGGGSRIPGTSLTVGHLYYQGASALADANATVSTKMPAICVADTTTSCLYSGVMRLSAAVAGCTQGKSVYVSASTGATCTRPAASGNQVQRFATMIASDNETMLVMPSLDVITVP